MPAIAAARGPSAAERMKMKKRTSKQIFADTILELSRHQTLDKITVKQIVEESGLSMQTFYNHFKDKYELILWIHKSEGDRLVAKLDRNGYGYDDLVRENLEFYIAHKEFMENALQNTYGKDSYMKQSAENAVAVWTRYILARHQLEELPQEVAFDLALYCRASVIMTAEWAFKTEFNLTAEQFARYMRNAMPPGLRGYLLA